MQKKRIILGMIVCCLYACGGGEPRGGGSDTLAIRAVQPARAYMGYYRWDSTGSHFTECYTQTVYEVAGGKAEKELKRLLFSINPGGAMEALVELEGYIAQKLTVDSAQAATVFMVDRLIDLDVQGECADVVVPLTQDSLFIRITKELEMLSLMYKDVPFAADSLQPEMDLNQLLVSEPMQLGFYAFMMAETGMSQQQMIQATDSLQTVLDVYRFLLRKDSVQVE